MGGEWKKLLDYWQSTLWRHALSFSFIVGAIKEYSHDKPSCDDSLEDLLVKLIDEMRSYQTTDCYHHIYRCPDIDSLVITKVNEDYPPQNAVPIENPKSDSPPSLYVSDGVNSNSSKPAQELIKSIIKESGEAIESGNYSRNGKQFGKFSEYDRKAIARALA